jgi:hypothetical protein
MAHELPAIGVFILADEAQLKPEGGDPGEEDRRLESRHPKATMAILATSSLPASTAKPPHRARMQAA